MGSRFPSNREWNHPPDTLFLSGSINPKTGMGRSGAARVIVKLPSTRLIL